MIYKYPKKDAYLWASLAAIFIAISGGVVLIGARSATFESSQIQYAVMGLFLLGISNLVAAISLASYCVSVESDRIVITDAFRRQRMVLFSDIVSIEMFPAGRTGRVFLFGFRTKDNVKVTFGKGIVGYELLVSAIKEGVVRAKTT